MQKIVNKILYNISKLLPARMIESLIILLESRIGIGCGEKPDRSGENVVLRILLEVASSPIIIFDVGANQGQYASKALATLGNSLNFTIHCFEPSLKTFEILNVRVGSNDRIMANNFGLTNESKNATLYMDSETSGIASLTKRKLEHFGIDHGKLEEEVKLETLDSYCENNNIEQISLLKIDVEGHELETLHGSSEMLKKNKIGLVQFEFGGCNIDTKTYFQDFFYFFSNHNYNIYRILPNCKLLLINSYRESEEKFRTMNYLAIPGEMKINPKYIR